MPSDAILASLSEDKKGINFLIFKDKMTQQQ